MTPELYQDVFAQDRRFADYVDQIGTVRHNAPRYEQAYRTLRAWFDQWSVWYADVGSRQGTTAQRIYDDLHGIWYPTARRAGFPESLFVVPDIEIDPPAAVSGAATGASTGGGHARAGVDPQPDPMSAALRRAVRAVIDFHDRSPAPFYVYVESELGARTGGDSSLQRAINGAITHRQEPGDVYLAVFDAKSGEWPDPTWSEFRAAPADRVAVGKHHRHDAPTPTPGPVTSPDQTGGLEVGPATVTPSVPQLSLADLYDSADQLFWNQTGYRPNHHLDPNDPADRAMIPQWWDAYHQVEAMWYAQTMASAPPGPHIDPATLSQQIPSSTPTVTSSGDPTMNSRDPWLPYLRSRPLSVGREFRSLAGWGARKSRRPELVGALAPVLAPATGGITATIDLDGNRVLHARVCVDGKCYQGSADLSGLMDALLAKVAAYHAGMHAAGAGGPPPALPANFDQAPPAPPAGASTFTPGETYYVPPAPGAATVGRGGFHGGGGYHGGGYVHPGGYARPGYGYARPRWGYRGGGGYAYYVPPVWEAEEVIVEDPYAYVEPDDQDVGPEPDAAPAPEPGAAPPGAQPAASATVSGDLELDRTIRMAGEMLVGQLVDHHVRIACAGWFDDLKHAVSKAAGGVEHAALGTLKKLSGPISTAAQYAAASVPGIGPIIGPMAGKLAGALVSAAAGDPAAAAQAKAVLNQAYQAAQSNPQVQQALDAAHQVVAKTTAAYHLAATASSAAQGNPAAVQQVQQTVQAAQQGDPAAQQAAAVMNQSAQATAANASCATPAASCAAPVDDSQIQVDPSVQGWVGTGAPHFYEIVGAAIGELRADAQRAVMAAHARTNAAVLGYVITAQGPSVVPLGSSDAADDWFGQLDPNAYVYAAYFDAGDPTWPAPLNEAIGAVVKATPPGAPIPRGVATVQGWALPMLLGAGLGAGAAYGWDHRDAIRQWLTGVKAA